MRLLSYLGFPFLIIVVGAVYWFSSHEPAGTVMLLIFSVAMGVLGWVLVPTFDDVGPTAPVDPDWHERQA
ncbi:MAG TPA: hypothetical protein VIH24_06750 [Candidatus Limnocylindria bacterium]|jgi:polyferredoxin